MHNTRAAKHTYTSSLPEDPDQVKRLLSAAIKFDEGSGDHVNLRRIYDNLNPVISLSSGKPTATIRTLHGVMKLDLTQPGYEPLAAEARTLRKMFHKRLRRFDGPDTPLVEVAAFIPDTDK